MKSKTRAAAGILAALLLATAAESQHSAGSAKSISANSAATQSFSPATQSAISAAVNKELAAFGGNTPVPGAIVGIWVPGKGTFAQAFGSSNLDPKTRLALNDKFRIGSNTKTFVISVLLQLVDEKKLSLDDPVSKFDLGVKIPNAENITVRELCQMRSGLLDAYSAPQYDKVTFTPQTAYTPQQIIATAVSNPPLFPPGAKWNYSNTNYLMLGLIIEAVTHHPIQDEISTRLLVPLRLKNTTFPTTNPDMPLPFAHGYALERQPEPRDAPAPSELSRAAFLRSGTRRKHARPHANPRASAGRTIQTRGERRRARRARYGGESALPSRELAVCELASRAQTSSR